MSDAVESPDVPSPSVSVGELGESAALQAIFPLLPDAPSTVLGPGDDAAIIGLSEAQVVISCDMMMEGPDFRLDWSTPVMVGRKAIASNAADIAAMGAHVVTYEIAVATPAHTPMSTLLDLARGFAQGISELTPEASIAGGDLSRAPVLSLAVTVLGDMRGLAPVTRSGARPGDVMAVGGPLGLSAAGLRLLLGAGDDSRQIAQLVAENELVHQHLAPQAPIALGPIAAEAGAHAMMDISDGLVLDATRMARASGVDIELDIDTLSAVIGAYPGVTLEDALFGGEDHSFLVAFPSNQSIPEGFTPIGVVTRASTAPEVTVPGRDISHERGGWDPFSPATAT
ncbi:thiamine-phosphate kinase [Pontimonas sp.]|nr:thiamine-phosphate kinase [Pontimonas sp.]MDA9114279.1 thiamine-phosphate kinase [Pontimonas sp.]